jgi:hypothetical protein
MSRFSLQHVALVCLALVMGFASPVIAAPKLVPFQATIDFTERVYAPELASPCLLLGTIAGEGSAGKLGNVSVASTDCIVPLSEDLFLFSSQQVVLTLGGGEIWATYGGTLTLHSGAITGLYFIHGGTGRFAHATGAGTITGFETLNPAAGEGTGWIQLKGSLAY